MHGENGSSRSSQLPSLVKLIRFPLLSLESFSEHVVPQNVLSNEEVIALFRFFARYEDQVTHPLLTFARLQVMFLCVC
jgi:hypothetical protein